MSHAALLVAVNCKHRSEIDAAVQQQMEPFYEGGKCFKDGSRWDYYVIGGRYSGRLSPDNVLRVRDIDLAKLAEQRKAELVEYWKEAQAMPENARQVIYRVKPGDTLEHFIARLNPHPFPSHYAFLRRRCWYEAGRMGWFGGQATTECEAHGDGDKTRKCLHKDPKTGAAVVTWNETEEQWRAKFYDRFIKPLSPDEWLVTVDYHV